MNREVPAKSYDRNERTRTAVDQLRILVETLYPEPSPDIFTLKDFTNRYPLTGLGELATREIEQAQRINRNLDNYINLGLCEFHIGLIYLYWGDSRGAVNQFQLARKNWNFTNAAASRTLCHFAEGLANFLALHHEEAMRCYSSANNSLSRVPPNDNEFYYQEISAYIKNAQMMAREAMWGSIKAKPADQTANDQGATPEPEAAATDHENVETPPQATPVSGAESKPLIQDVDQPTGEVPLPQIHFSPHGKNITMPLPGHKEPNPNYVWYQVEKRTTDNLYKDVSDGDWLLVNTQPSDNTTVEKNELVLVTMEEDIGNAIKIRSNRSVEPYQRIYLAKNDTDFIGPFNRNLDTGEVSLIKVTFSSQDQQISVQWSAIIGVVEGFWRNIQFRQSI